MEHTGSMLPIIAGSESNRALENEVDQTATDCFDDIDSDEHYILSSINEKMIC